MIQASLPSAPLPAFPAGLPEIGDQIAYVEAETCQGWSPGVVKAVLYVEGEPLYLIETAIRSLLVSHRLIIYWSPTAN